MIWVPMLLGSLFPKEATKDSDEHGSCISTNTGFVLILNYPIRGKMHKNDSPIIQCTSFAYKYKQVTLTTAPLAFNILHIGCR